MSDSALAREISVAWSMTARACSGSVVCPMIVVSASSWRIITAGVPTLACRILSKAHSSSAAKLS